MSGRRPRCAGCCATQPGASPSPQAPHASNSVVRHLCSGIARCGRCGGPLYVMYPDTPEAAYKCRGQGCGRVQRKQSLIDDEVTKRIVDRLAALAHRPKNATGTQPPTEPEPASTFQPLPEPRLDALRAEQELLDARLAEALVDYRNDRIALHLLARIEADIAARAAEIEAEIRAHLATGVGSVEGLPPPLPPEFVGKRNARRAWTNADVRTRRQVLRALTRRVVVHPVGRGRHPFDPASVELIWR